MQIKQFQSFQSFSLFNPLQPLHQLLHTLQGVGWSVPAVLAWIGALLVPGGLVTCSSSGCGAGAWLAIRLH